MIKISYLYVTENGASINVDGGYFVVSHKDGMIHKIPKETLESVSLFGNIAISTPCAREFLKLGIPVSYFSSRGAYYGRLESTGHKNISRLKKQIYTSDNEDFSLALAKNIIKAKVSNQRTVLKRYVKYKNTDISAELKNIDIAKVKIDSAESSEELIGYEGTAAKYYFSALSKLIDPEFAFRGRNRMPPKDPFNSMISLGYTLLMYELYGEIENKGLTPYCGFLHKDHERHPTLASDLMEEWRAVIIDSTVLSLIQGKEIHSDCFVTDEESGGVFLTSEGMRIFLNKYENKLRSENRYIDNLSMSLRKCLWYQVNTLVKAIETNQPELYKPVLIR
ncbi:MAG: CRISPR-associated endonuclease Cas1 [Oscillospiraceae bacterium]|nr:CRISPR-associated endonuclease Cas1 [Oscillospiraceae bacterium]